MKNLALSIFAAVAFIFSGCATGNPQLTPANVQNYAPLISSAASIATSEALLQVKDPAKRKVDANYIYSIAVGIRTISGTNPTTDQLATVLKQFGAPDDPQIAILTKSLTDLYTNYYKQYATDKNGVQITAVILESIAEGAETAAASATN